MKIKFEVSITLKETILYAISGVLTTLVNFSVSYLLYNICGVNENITNAVAWVAAVVFAFFAAHVFVFKTTGKNGAEKMTVLNRFFMFVIGRIFTLIVELAATFIFVTKMEADFWIIKVTISVLIIILNYLISKFIVFKKKPVQIEEADD